MSEKKELTITILSRSYSIVTDEDHELVECAAGHLNSLLKRSVGPSSSPVEIAKKTTFVALQIAVELLKKRQELEARGQEIELKHQELEERHKELRTIGDKTSTLNDLLKESLV